MATLNQSPAGALVLGMSRSGTSAVAGAFRAAGFFPGSAEELMQGDENNPRGYVENLRIHAENERILQESGGSWFDPPEPEALVARTQEIDKIRSLVLQLVDEAAGAPILIKDPRVGVLMPLWTVAAQDLLHPVLVLRDPLEIASSLERRDGTPGPVALAGWEVHMCAVLAGLQGRSVTVVRYSDVVSEPSRAEQAVQEAAAALDPRVRDSIRPERVRDALDSTLWRARSAELAYGRSLTGFQQEIWAFLAATPVGTHRLDVPTNLQQPTEAARRAVRAETSRVKALEDRDWLQEHYDLLDAQLWEARQVQDHATRARDLAIAEARAMSDSLSWRLTKPLRDLMKTIRRSPRSG